MLVFDEMLTGFRFAPGGAQEYFGVTPDLASFGKALANGFPLSAIVGKREILELMPTIFFSGTFGGETLSLAAATVVLDRMATGEPTRRLAEIGAAAARAQSRLPVPSASRALPVVQRPSDLGLPAVVDRRSRDPGAGQDPAAAGDSCAGACSS